MSSILKALEKAEESQNARRSGGPSGIVKSKQRRPVWMLPVGVLAGAAVASLVTYAAMGGFSKARHKPVEEKVAAAVEAQAPAAMAPPAGPQASVANKAEAKAAAPAVVAAPAPTAAPVAPIAKAAPVTKPIAAAPASAVSAKSSTATAKVAAAPAKPSAKKVAAVQPAKGKKTAAKAETKSKTASAPIAKAAAPVRTAKMPPPPVVRPAAVQVAPVQAAPAPAPPVKQVAQTVAPAAPKEKKPEVRVTGIAWQHDSESSAVIVNGRMVQHGETVDGYKVERIYEDKVRFSGKNGSIEVPLGGGE